MLPISTPLQFTPVVSEKITKTISLITAIKLLIASLKSSTMTFLKDPLSENLSNQMFLNVQIQKLIL